MDTIYGHQKKKHFKLNPNELIFIAKVIKRAGETEEDLEDQFDDEKKDKIDELR